VRNLVNLIDRRFLWDRADSELARLSAPVAPVSPEAQRRSIYFLHNSLPFTSAGYATRTHGICLGVAKRDFDIRPVTRPGFPLDLGLEVTAADVPQASEIDGITYRRLVDFQRPDFSEPEYITRTADVFERILREHRPGLVHAASNYVTGLPALIAARRAALPYVYEARGFWEITRASREPNFRNSGQFRGMANLEALCAREADAVITLTTAMKDVLIERGVAEEKITLVHNSVDAARFVPRPRDEVLAARLGVAPDEPVIGYIGSHVIYEGLDDLIEACARLREKDVAFRLLLVGDGKETPDLLRRAEARGLSDRLIAPGRVPHEEVESYYSLVDIAPFPRKPWEVCEVVSPLKPFEAMAMEKAVIVSDVRALAEIASDGETGLHFRKGSVDNLSDALERLLADPGLRRDLGKAARAWIETHRTWDIAGARVADVYAQVLEARTTAER
jgi:glycosyltransferase involved in cell wall biosynthesis